MREREKPERPFVSNAWPRAPSCPRLYFRRLSESRRSRRRAYHFHPRGPAGPCSRDASVRTRPLRYNTRLVPLVVLFAILTQLARSWSACRRCPRTNSWPCAIRRRADRPRSPARPTRAIDPISFGASRSCLLSFLAVKHKWRRRRPASGGRGPACWRVSVSRRRRPRRWRRVWCLGVDGVARPPSRRPHAMRRRVSVSSRVSRPTASRVRRRAGRSDAIAATPRTKKGRRTLQNTTPCPVIGREYSPSPDRAGPAPHRTSNH
jgi:hypothetical protein